MSNYNPDERISVAAVCGNEVRVYHPLSTGETERKLFYTKQFPHYGAAKLYADEFEDSQRKPVVVR